MVLKQKHVHKKNEIQSQIFLAFLKIASWTSGMLISNQWTACKGPSFFRRGWGDLFFSCSDDRVISSHTVSANSTYSSGSYQSILSLISNKTIHGPQSKPMYHFWPHFRASSVTPAIISIFCVLLMLHWRLDGQLQHRWDSFPCNFQPDKKRNVWEMVELNSSLHQNFNNDCLLSTNSVHNRSRESILLPAVSVRWHVLWVIP